MSSTTIQKSCPLQQAWVQTRMDGCPFQSRRPSPHSVPPVISGPSVLSAVWNKRDLSYHVAIALHLPAM